MNSIASDWNPQWLDSMYNNRLLVPGYAAHFTRWVADSDHVRQQQPCLLDVAYGEQSGETLDIFPASGVSPAQGAPVLVFIHGGYWRARAARDFSCVAFGPQALQQVGNGQQRRCEHGQKQVKPQGQGVSRFGGCQFSRQPSDFGAAFFLLFF